MKAYGYLFVVLVLSTVAANDGFAAQAQASRNEGRPGASGKAVATNGGHPARGQAPKHGGLPGAVGKTGGEGPGGGKGSSSINGTEIRADSASINGTGMGAQH